MIFRLCFDVVFVWVRVFYKGGICSIVCRVFDNRRKSCVDRK